MKLIGITGKSGSGKTTLSNMLKRDEDVDILHLDEIVNLDKLKAKLPSEIMQQNSNQMGETSLVLNGNLKIIKDRLIKNRVLGRIYDIIRTMPQKHILNQKLKQYKEKGIQVLIIEGSQIGEFSIFNNLSYLVQVDAPFVIREKRVTIRNDYEISKEEMVKRDKNYIKRKRRDFRKQIDRKVINTGSLEELQLIGDEIYNEQIATNRRKDNRQETMKEKYGGYKAKVVEMKPHIRDNKKDKQK